MTAAKKIAEAMWKAVIVERQPAVSVAERFARLAKEYRLEHLAPVVSRYLDLLANQDRIAKTLSITTSHEPSAAVTDLVKRTIDAPVDTPVTSTTDPNLVGGFVAEYDHKVYDGSLRHELSKIKAALAK